MSQLHSLKILPEYFEAVVTGEKTFEVRKDDRGYRVGDTLMLNEINPSSGMYTGRNVKVKVTYILRGGHYGIEQEYIIMSIQKQ